MRGGVIIYKGNCYLYVGTELEYAKSKEQQTLTDYKFMCFNGKFRCSFGCTDRFSPSGLKVTFFDENGERLPFERHYKASTEEIKMPEQYNEMIELAEKLSKGIPFVRVDFYVSCDRIYFGELTFYPGSGMEDFHPEIWDYKLGDWLSI